MLYKLIGKIPSGWPSNAHGIVHGITLLTMDGKRRVLRVGKCIPDFFCPRQSPLLVSARGREILEQEKIPNIEFKPSVLFSIHDEFDLKKFGQTPCFKDFPHSDRLLDLFEAEDPKPRSMRTYSVSSATRLGVFHREGNEEKTWNEGDVKITVKSGAFFTTEVTTVENQF